MKRYISPEIVVVEIEASAIMFGTSPTGEKLNMSVVTDPTQQGGSTDKLEDFAAPTYRSSLWND